MSTPSIRMPRPVARLRSMIVCVLFAAAFSLLAAPSARAMGHRSASEPAAGDLASRYFRIQVVDEATSRGVPMVHLTTNYTTAYITDSAGVVAFLEPDLMGKEVFFRLSSYGYSYPQAWGSIKLRAAPGGSATIPVRRNNIAERLYRLTGVGIYRDSRILGDKVYQPADLPIGMPSGQDSVVSVVYKGRKFYIWGDTNIADRPLGNFRSSGALSDLPGKGGWDPDQGMNLEYFTTSGTVQGMVNYNSPGLVWLGNLRVAHDPDGRERLFADYDVIRGYLQSAERGLCEFSDETRKFEIVQQRPKDAVIYPDAMVCTPVTEPDGRKYFYYRWGWPAIRSGADSASVLDLSSYEAMTCLKDGEAWRGGDTELDRDANGELRWAWRKNTAPIHEQHMGELVRAGKMQPDEMWYRMSDFETSLPLSTHRGSVYWNEYRQRWIAIHSVGHGVGVAGLGEIFYFEGDTPLGPWTYGRRVITHTMAPRGRRAPANEGPRSYSLYNPSQHPEFDKDGGRIIYLEGTYTQEFSSDPVQTPYYNYNQMIYKLTLTDPRLFLPVPVYEVAEKAGRLYRTKTQTPDGGVRERVSFYAPDRPLWGTVPVVEQKDEAGGVRLVCEAAKDTGAATTDTAQSAAAAKAAAEPAKPPVVFYAVPADATFSGDSPLRFTVPLYEFTDKSGVRSYSTSDAAAPGLRRSEQPVCRVWPSPSRFNPWKVADPAAKTARGSGM